MLGFICRSKARMGGIKNSLPGKLYFAFLGGKLQAFILIFQMNQLSSMVKTFVEDQESMLESLDKMIERQSQEQVSRMHRARTDLERSVYNMRASEACEADVRGVRGMNKTSEACEA